MKTLMQDFATGDTTTATTGISTVQGKYWIKEILDAAKQRMYFEQFAYRVVVTPGNKDVAVPVVTTHLTFTKSTAESTDRTMTQADNMNTVTFTPADAKFGATISKTTVRTSQVNMITFAREEMIYSAALQVDQAFATAIAAASSPAGTLYGGDATSTASLSTGDVLTTTLVAQANRLLKTYGWMPEKDKPFVLFISACQEEAFLRDSQFINAAEYGQDSVVMTGEIGSYLGIKIIQTEQVTSASTWGGGALAGHVCFFVKAKVAYGIAWGEEPTLDFEYDKDPAKYKIYLDSAYQCKTLQEKAIVLIKVADA